MPYSRKELIELRNSVVIGQLEIGHLIPKDVRRSEEPQPPVTKTTALSYNRDQLLQLRRGGETTGDEEGNVMLKKIPDDLRRTRFRCESNCVNEQQHETKQAILKYTRNELVLLRQQQQTCAALSTSSDARLDAQSKAPEIFVRSLGR